MAIAFARFVCLYNNNYTNTQLIHILCEYYLNYFSAQPAPEQLPYLSLGTTAGVDREYVGHFDDGVSHAIHIPNGFPFGSFIHSSVYVSNLYIW